MYFIDFLFLNIDFFKIGFVSRIYVMQRWKFLQIEIWATQINKYYNYIIINLTQEDVTGFDCIERRSVASHYYMYGSKISGSQQ